MNDDELLTTIRESVVGRSDLVDGPFGPRPVIYADYTASGRALGFIEDYVREIVMPLYANTHSELAGTGRQTTRFREEARAIIADAVGAGEDHTVLFCGSGATHAIAKLIDVLGLRIQSALVDRYRLDQSIPDDRPVVFLGPYEHHSNELPWRESIAEVVRIEEDADGHIDLQHLEAELRRVRNRSMVIGSFSAASNVTGIISDTRAVSTMLHRYGALAFWDFAAAAPYLPIDMGPSSEADLAYFDAIFISPHKFIGGPGTPGVLVARRELFTNRVPVVPGGGTVRYVNAEQHDYADQIELREEGGTPGIIESIRAGLVFQLKEAVGAETIAAREKALVREAIASWSKNSRIQLLGSPEAERLSIVSFVVRSDDRFLHHNFVVALLNDLFGIQSRGGCSCAGPYGHRLLGIDLDRSHGFQQEITRGCEGIKPGWIRVGFNYFIDEATFRYIVDAVHFVANEGHRFLRFYSFEPDSGMWRHRDPASSPTMSLHDISYDGGGMHYANDRTVGDQSLAAYLAEAHRLVASTEGERFDAAPNPVVTDHFERLRWFPYPGEDRWFPYPDEDRVLHEGIHPAE